MTVYYGVRLECSCGVSVSGGMTSPHSVWEIRKYFLSLHANGQHRLTHDVRELDRELAPVLTPRAVRETIRSGEATDAIRS